MLTRHLSTRQRVLVLAVSATSVLGACGGAGPSKSVTVLHAGSLVNLVDAQVGPAFAKSSGEKFVGFGAASQEVANAIKGKTQTGDVFISASPSVNASLEGASNGSWVSWYATFATAPLVIGYNPSSKFARDFRTKPWYEVLTERGIRLGRTDPTLDPKGKLTVAALTSAARMYHLPTSFIGTVEKAAAVFPEQDLQGRLQAGQIDAGFFYTNESTPLHLQTVSLGKVHEAATFTVTVLNHAKDPKPAAAFVAYLLTTAKPVLTKSGLHLLKPTVTGARNDVPDSLRNALGL